MSFRWYDITLFKYSKTRSRIELISNVKDKYVLNVYQQEFVVKFYLIKG